MVLVVTFVVTVDWLHCEAKWQPLLGGNDNVLSGRATTCFFPDRMSSFLPSNGCHFALQRNQSTETTNATTKTIKRSTWIRCKINRSINHCDECVAGFSLTCEHSNTWLGRLLAGRLWMDLDTWQSKFGVGSSRSVAAVALLSVTGFTLPCEEKGVKNTNNTFCRIVCMKNVLWLLNKFSRLAIEGASAYQRSFITRDTIHRHNV